MKTRIIKVSPHAPQQDKIARAARVLASGGIVAFPTETTYKLAASLDHPQAMERLRKLKGQQGDKPFTIHISSPDDVIKYAKNIPPIGKRLMRRFWPGPLTIVIPSHDGRTVGLRLPKDIIARQIISQSRVRVVATSANRPDTPPPTDVQSIINHFNGKVELIVDAGPTPRGIASTVVEVKKRSLEILRQGAVSEELLESVNKTVILLICTGNLCRSPMAEGILKAKFAERLAVPPEDLEEHGFSICSAGTAAIEGSMASPNAIDAASEINVDISMHRSKPVTPTMVEESDYVFVMTRSHRDTIVRWVPDCAHKVELLHPEGKDIEDPIGQPIEVYRKCRDIIAESLQRIDERFFGEENKE